MELVDSLEEMFQWRTPFCTNLLNEVMEPEETTPSVDAMLVDIELPEIYLGPEQAAPVSHPNPASLSLWPPNPVSIPLSPPQSSRTIPVVTSAFPAPSSVRNPFVVNVKPCSVQTGTTGFEIPAPTTPMSSAPNTPPVVKPKRSRGSGTAKPKGTPLKKKKKNPQELGLDGAEPKSRESRVPTTAEHIIRERQRRDDMSAKYSILESLLPPSMPKRERAVVVTDTISFVGALEQKKAQLLNRRADLKLMAFANESPLNKKTRSKNCKSDSPISASSDGVLVRADPEIVTTAGTISAFHAHIGEQEVLLEMVWNKPRPNFQSALLQAVQSLGFDVMQCSILRVGKDCIQCVVTCFKSQVLPQRTTELIQSSSTLIIRALRNMLTRS